MYYKLFVVGFYILLEYEVLLIIYYRGNLRFRLLLINGGKVLFSDIFNVGRENFIKVFYFFILECNNRWLDFFSVEIFVVFVIDYYR